MPLRSKLGWWLVQLVCINMWRRGGSGCQYENSLYFLSSLPLSLAWLDLAHIHGFKAVGLGLEMQGTLLSLGNRMELPFDFLSFTRMIKVPLEKFYEVVLGWHMLLFLGAYYHGPGYCLAFEQFDKLKNCMWFRDLFMVRNIEKALQNGVLAQSQLSKILVRTGIEGRSWHRWSPVCHQCWGDHVGQLCETGV